MTEDRSRYSMFPVKNHKLWDYYKRQSHAFWIPEEIDLSRDLADFNRLNANEKHFIKNVLAFFNEADGIINENLALRFYNDIEIPEVRAFYSMQMAIESIHAETYSLLIETYIKNTEEKNKLLNAVSNIPAIRKKAEWALKWISSSQSFEERLFAFAVIEGLFFSGSFCAIFWLKKRGLMPGLSKSNEFISRDEGLHWAFAAELYKHLNLRAPKETLHAIIKEAVEIEKEFVCDSLPVGLIGMNSDLMGTYIDYTADRILQNFNLPKIYNCDNPFSFMTLIDLDNKTNFFENRVSEYAKGHDMVLEFAAEF